MIKFILVRNGNVVKLLVLCREKLLLLHELMHLEERKPTMLIILLTKDLPKSKLSTLRPLAVLVKELIINDIIKTDIENINYLFSSEKFSNFSKINFKGNYDLKENDNKEYSIGYSYFDECFGINLDFDRKFYSDNDLKPQDVLTLMFSFKNVGSYRSTNLAVSETDKQDIRWELFNVNNELDVLVHLQEISKLAILTLLEENGIATLRIFIYIKDPADLDCPRFNLGARQFKPRRQNQGPA